MRLKRLFLGVMLLVGITGAGATNAAPEDISASISLKGHNKNQNDKNNTRKQHNNNFLESAGE